MPGPDRTGCGSTMRANEQLLPSTPLPYDAVSAPKSGSPGCLDQPETGFDLLYSSQSCGSSSYSEAGVEDGIEQVDHEVDEHEGYGREHHQRLKDRDVLIANSALREAADAVQAENSLRHYGA